MLTEKDLLEIIKKDSLPSMEGFMPIEILQGVQETAATSVAAVT